MANSCCSPCTGRCRKGAKRVTSSLIHATRFSSLFLRVSLSQNRCTLPGDMHQNLSRSVRAPWRRDRHRRCRRR
ncbi:hypothetical protein RHECNPAF_770019 [Rhizobium etli CNPAF512]|nr:hypothetical protein RHECNPAF_770019 [Rhizobium etli CNPAF512]